MKYRSLKIFAIFFVVFALLSLIFFCIECKNASEQNITCLGDALWYSAASFFAIGYGDIVTLSCGGKILKILFILFGFCFLGSIIGRISSSFTNQMEKRRLGLMGTNFERHAVIIGWNDVAEDITRQLTNADHTVAVVTDKKDDIDLIYRLFNKKQVFALFSDTTKLHDLDKINIAKAHTVFINNGNDTDKLMSILNIQRQYPQMQFVVLLNNKNLKETFVSAGVTYVLSNNEIVSKLLASYIFEPAVADFTCDLMSAAESKNKNDYDLQQYRVTESFPYLNKPYGEMFSDIKNRFNIIAVGLNKSAGRGLLKLPEDDEIIALNDDIIVIANGESELKLKKLINNREGV